MPCQKLGGFLKLCVICGVEGISAGDECRSEDVAGIVHHDDIVCVFFIPQAVPAGDRFVDHGVVVKDADGSPQIGDCMRRIRIKFLYGIQINRINVGNIGDIIIVNFQKQAIVQHFLDHIFRRTDHIPVCRTVGDDRIHILIGVKSLVIDLDTGLFFKHVNDVFINVFTPVIDIYFSVFTGGGAATSGKHGCCQQAAAYKQNSFFHNHTSYYSFASVQKLFCQVPLPYEECPASGRISALKSDRKSFRAFFIQKLFFSVSGSPQAAAAASGLRIPEPGRRQGT